MGFEKFKWIGVFCFLLFSISGFSQKGVPYRIYNAKGKAISFDKMTRGLKGVDVVLFGEFHDNSLGHWLELELLKTMHLKRDLIVGAEMFEVDNQDALSAYLMGILSEDEFLHAVYAYIDVLKNISAEFINKVSEIIIDKYEERGAI